MGVLTDALLHKKNNAQINFRNRFRLSPLELAINTGIPNLVQFLLNAGADVNAADEGGNTPLHSAAGSEENEIVQIVQLLLEAGADVNAANEWGHTPLQLAKRYNYTDIVNVIKEFIKNNTTAFVMASHARLGVNSSARVLPRHLMRDVVRWNLAKV